MYLSLQSFLSALYGIKSCKRKKKKKTKKIGKKATQYNNLERDIKKK